MDFLNFHVFCNFTYRDTKYHPLPYAKKKYFQKHRLTKLVKCEIEDRKDVINTLLRGSRLRS